MAALGLHHCVGFPLAALSGGCALAVVCRLLTAAAPLVKERRFYRVDFSSCGSGLSDWDSDLVAQRRVESSQTCAPCTGSVDS